MVQGTTLYQLIASTEKARSLHGQAGQYGMAKSMTKEFGTIYYNNKVVYYDPRNRILEIRMFMGTATETAYKGYHAVRMAIYNVRGKVYDSIEQLYQDKIVNEAIKNNWTGSEKELLDKVKDREEHIRAMKSSVKGDSTGWRARGFDKNLPDLDSNRVEIDYLNELNNRLSGAIIPVASSDPKDFGHIFGNSGKFFYLEDNYIDYNSYVRVSCSCSSYYYRFAWDNFYAGVHLGQKPMPYQKSGKNKDISVQNVGGNEGMCKHLLMFTMLLLNGGIINRLGVKDFNKNRSTLLNREERLNIPKQMATKRELEKIYKSITRTARKEESSAAIAAYKEYQKKQYKKNTEKGIRYNKGVNKAAYLDRLASIMPKPVVNNKNSKNSNLSNKVNPYKNISESVNAPKISFNDYVKNYIMNDALYKAGKVYSLDEYFNAYGGKEKYMKEIEKRYWNSINRGNPSMKKRRRK